jgi:hypothetical protein
MDVATHEGPPYAPAPLASAIEVLNTPVTGAAVAGDTGPCTLTDPAEANVALNPGGSVPVPHSIAVKETAMAVKPYPALVHQEFKLPPPERASSAFAPVVKFQPVGAINVTCVIAYALDAGLASVRL